MLGMNITYISGSRIPSREANSIHVMRMCQALALNGHRVTLLAIGSTSDKHACGDYSYYGVDSCFDIVKCPYPKIRLIGRLLNMLCILSKTKSYPLPNVFYARYAYALVAVSGLEIPMILEVHDVPSGWRLKAALKNLFSKTNFARLVAISAALAAEYQRIFPELSPAKVVVAHDGADASVEQLEAVSFHRLGRAEALQVGYVGHLYPGRGIEMIIALASLLPDIDFHIVGGTDADILCWKMACSLQNITFHGYVTPGEVSKLFASFDVLVAPYQSSVSSAGGRNTARWMSPLKIFEYMASGKAIVCSDLPVLREVLTHQVNALLVPPSDTYAWTQAISQLCEDADLRSRIGRAAKDEFLAHYTWEKRAMLVLRDLDL